MNTERGDVKPPEPARKTPIGESLRSIRGSETQDSFADRMGVSVNTLRRYESGERTPDAEFLVHLWKITRADINAVLGLPTSQPRAGESIAPAYGVSGAEKEFANYVLVPFYDIAVSAGAGAEVLDTEPKAWNAWRRDYIAKRGLVASQLAEFSVQGDSMSPELNHGDTVLVDRRATEIGGEAIYVLRIENTLLVKYVRREWPNGYVLRSVNASSYPAQLVTPDQFPQWQFEVVGRVVRQGRDR